MALALAVREHGDGVDKLRLRLLPVFLEEALAADAFRHADHGQRPLGEMREDVRRHLREIAQQIALGQRRLLERLVFGPVDTVEVRELELVRPDGEVELVALVFELGEDLLHVVIPAKAGIQFFF